MNTNLQYDSDTKPDFTANGYGLILGMLSFIILIMCWSIMNFVNDANVYYWILEYIYYRASILIAIGLVTMITHGH